MDIDPPYYVTFEGRAFGRNSLTTIRVSAVEGGSRIELLNGAFEVLEPAELPPEIQGSGPGSLQKLAAIIEQDIENGVIRPEHFEESAGLKVKLARPGVAKGRYANIVRG